MDEISLGLREAWGKRGVPNRGAAPKCRRSSAIKNEIGAAIQRSTGSKNSLPPITIGKISAQSILYSDDSRGYDGLIQVRGHVRINKKRALQKGGPMSMEPRHSEASRRLAKFNGVPSTFSLHLKERERRYKNYDDRLEKDLKAPIRKDRDS